MSLRHTQAAFLPPVPEFEDTKVTEYLLELQKAMRDTLDNIYHDFSKGQAIHEIYESADPTISDIDRGQIVVRDDTTDKLYTRIGDTMVYWLAGPTGGGGNFIHDDYIGGGEAGPAWTTQYTFLFSPELVFIHPDTNATAQRGTWVFPTSGTAAQSAFDNQASDWTAAVRINGTLLQTASSTAEFNKAGDDYHIWGWG